MTSILDEHYKKMNDDTEVAEIDTRVSHIQQFYSGKSIFLTGATGFMGKCFVEKILRACQDLKKLYILVRPTKKITAEEKVQKYFNDVTFDRLRSVHPNFLHKIAVINGDLQSDRLGITDEDRRLLINETDIIVHNAANVKFYELTHVSLTINVLGTKHMLDLAMDCKHLQAFMYVSTAFSPCWTLKIEEKFYESPGDMKLVHDMIKADKVTPSGLSNDALKMMLGKWPNIYIFTKAFAEDLVRQYGERASFPCAVFRPAMVSASCEEPIPGWLGNFNGPALAFWGAAIGAVHTFLDKGNPMDLIPADISINALIGIIYDMPKRWEIEKAPAVFNCGSSVANPVYLRQSYQWLCEEGPRIGSTKTLWQFFAIMPSQKWLFYILHFFLHFVPACLADLVLLCMWKKPRALKLFKLGHEYLGAMLFFMTSGFLIHVDRTLQVYDSLSPADQRIFNFDIRTIDWEDTLVKYIRYVRVYIMKEPLDNLKEARRHYRRMKLLHNTVKAIFFAWVAYLALKLVNFFISFIF